MFTFILSASVGAYLAQRISVVRDREIVSLSVDYQRMWSDAIAFFAFIGVTANWVISIGKSARSFVESRVMPILESRGVAATLPSWGLLLSGQSTEEAEFAAELSRLDAIVDK